MENKPIKLNIGCGLSLVSGFINVDKTYKYEDLISKKGFFINARVDPDAEYIQADVLKLPFPDEYADYIESIDMIEHIPFRETLNAIKEMRRVLKTGGTIKVVTDNFDDVVKMWAEQIIGKDLDFSDKDCPFYNLREIFYGNQANVGEFHCSPINPRYAYALFRNAGFENIEIMGYPKGTPCDLPELETNGTKESKQGLVMRSEMILIKAVK